MSEPPTRCRPRKRRFWKAWRRSALVALRSAVVHARDASVGSATRLAWWLCSTAHRPPSRGRRCASGATALPPMTDPNSLPILRLTSNQEAHARFQRSRIRAVPAHRYRCAGRWPAGRRIRGARESAAISRTATLYLPTRRAGRLAREIFLDELKTDAAILPRIVALGDIDEDELAFSEGSEQFGGMAPLDLPPGSANSNAG